MKEIHFNPELATVIGLKEAVFMQVLNDIITFESNRIYHSDQRSEWLRITQDEFLEYFPFWSKKTIRTIIKSCTDSNYVLKENRNSDKMDMTLSYRIAPSMIKYLKK
jgi:hypothetical protein